MKKLLFCCFIGLFNLSNAWNGHHLITYYSLASLNKNVYYQNVPVESLQHFLEQVKYQLPQELNTIEQLAINTQLAYKPTPLPLKFNPNDSLCNKNIEKCFKIALRVNLDVPLVPIIYDPEDLTTNKSRISDVSSLMLKEEVTQAAHLIGDNEFKAVQVGDLVPLITVIAGGSEEPDLGLDIALYQNNNSEFGKIYGFGDQPIGDVGLKYTSQSLFHMATYKLSKIFTYLRPNLRYSYSQYRFYEYMHLAKFAKETGHPYWAARFMGWAMHYMQDMTQPYHANLFNGFYDIEVLYAYANSVIMKNDRLIIALQNKLEERHMISEDIAGYLLSGNNKSFGDAQQQMRRSLKNTAYEMKIPACSIEHNYIIDAVVPQTYTFGWSYSRTILDVFPKELVNNPSGINFEKIDYIKTYRDLSTTNKEKLLHTYTNRMQYVGAYTRSCAFLVF